MTEIEITPEVSLTDHPQSAGGRQLFPRLCVEADLFLAHTTEI